MLCSIISLLEYERLHTNFFTIRSVMPPSDKQEIEVATGESSKNVKKPSIVLAIKTIICSALSSYLVIVLVGLIFEFIERMDKPFDGTCHHAPDIVMQCSYKQHLMDIILPMLVPGGFGLIGTIFVFIPLFFIFFAISYRIFFGKNENNAFQRGCFTGCAVVLAAFLGMQILTSIHASREIKKFEEMQRTSRPVTTHAPDVGVVINEHK